MKLSFVVTLAFAAALLTLGPVGCPAKKTGTGGPGATGTHTGDTGDHGDNKDNTFSMSVPAKAVDIDKKAKEKVSVTIDRGADFKQKVTIKLKPAAGLTVAPAEKVLASNETEAEFEITAGDKAGDHTIEVTGTPETGKAVTKTISVHVND